MYLVSMLRLYAAVGNPPHHLSLVALTAMRVIDCVNTGDTNSWLNNISMLD